MGACTVTKVRQLGHWPWQQGKRAALVQVALSASYATGGDTMSAAVDFGFKRVTGMFVVTAPAIVSGFPATAPSAGGYKYTLGGTPVAPTVVATKGAGTPAEETATTNMSTHNFYAIVVGE